MIFEDELDVEDTEVDAVEEMASEDAEREALDFSDIPTHEGESPADQLDFSDLEEDEEDIECPFSIELRCKVIEAALFISDKPVGLTTLVAAFGVDEETRKNLALKKHVLEGVEALTENLEEQDRGFRLHQVDGGYQLRTSDDIKDFLHNTVKARSFRLTGPSLETLAMVAYKQPITKSQVDEIRGVDSSHLLRALMDRGLVSFAGKSELPGKPMLYKTTSKFLNVFGLRNLKELPSLSEIEALLPNGIGEEEEEKETLSELTGKLSENFDGSYSAGEEELGKITDELSDISTSSDFFEQEKQREKERREAEKAENIREALMVGEEVSTRDQNWLARYDERLQALSEDGDEVAESESAEEPSEPIEADEGALEASDQISEMDFVEEEVLEEEPLVDQDLNDLDA